MIKKTSIIWQKHKYILMFLAIVILAIVLRFPFLSVFPPAMVQDEVGLAYSAISIAETGRDEWGEAFPLLFKSFGEYKSPVFIYLTAALYKLINWHQVLPRITSAIAGVLIVILSILWIRQSTHSKKLALLAGLLVATNPWAIHLSRMALESNVALAFFLTGLLLIGVKNTILSTFVSAVFFSLSAYTYNAYKFLTIGFLLAYISSIVLFNYKKIKNQQALLKKLFIILVVSSLLSLPMLLVKNNKIRMNQVLLVSSEKQLQLYKHYENNCHLTFSAINPRLSVICRLAYNKFSRPVLITVKSYLKHLSPGFYFFTGDAEVGRNPTQTGQFYPFLIIFWMIGLVKALENPRKHLLFLSGFLLTILPSVVAGDPHAIRLTPVIPFILLSVISGYQYFREKICKQKIIDYFFVTLLLLSTIFYSFNYMISTSMNHELTNSYLSYAKKISNIAYDYVERGYRVYADLELYPEPHIYYAYWNKIDPILTQQSFRTLIAEDSGFTRPTQFGGQMFFEKFNLATINCDSPDIKTTALIRKEQLPNIQALQVIRDPSNTYDIAYIYETWQWCPAEH